MQNNTRCKELFVYIFIFGLISDFGHLADNLRVTCNCGSLKQNRSLISLEAKNSQMRKKALFLPVHY